MPTTRPSAHRAPDPQPEDGGALLLTADEDLAAHLRTLAAVAGCPLHQPPPGPTGGTAGAALLLVGEDAADADVLAARAAGAEVVLTARAPVGPDWWRRAAELDVDHAAVLPEAEPWLLERLGDVADGPGAPGRVVGVVGGTGGAGASTVAAALAAAAAEAGDDVLLLDADPLSGGLDLLLGADQLPGLRWSDVAGAGGRLRPGVLRGCVDVADGLRLLTGERDGSAAATGPLVEVLGAARRTFDLTVLDLPRGSAAELPAAVLDACEEVLVVLPATARGAAAACTVVDRLRRSSTPPDVRLVLREVGAPALVDDLVDLVGAPLAGVLRPERDLDAALERGEGLPASRRSPVRVLAARWVADTRAPAPVRGRRRAR